MTRKLTHPDVRIEPTNRCNYRCTMCPRDKHTRKQGVMEMGLYKKIVDELIPMGVKQITLVNFGEPMLDPTLADKVYYATQKGLRTYTVTNGSLFHQKDRSEFSTGQNLTKIEALAKAGLTELRISLYGTNKKDYEKIMVGGNFERILKNIELIKSAREEYGNPIISTYFLQMEREDGLSRKSKEFLKFVSKESKNSKPLADIIEIWRPHNFGSGRNFRDTSSKKRESCLKPMQGPLQINYDGIIVPCCMDFNSDMPLGNVNIQSIREILDGKPFTKLREMHRNKTFGDSYCGKCDQLQKHDNALIFSNNPSHQGRDKKSIMKSVNSMATVEMDEKLNDAYEVQDETKN